MAGPCLHPTKKPVVKVLLPRLPGRLDTSTTNLGLDDARRGVAVAFARKTSSGAVELFVPEIFQQGQQQMQQAFQSAFDNMKVQVGSGSGTPPNK